MIAAWLTEPGWTHQRLAEALAVSLPTVRRWANEPGVRAELARLSSPASAGERTNAIQALRDLAPRAAAAVGDVLDDDESPAAVKLRAAELSLRSVGALELPSRLRPAPRPPPRDKLEEAQRRYEDADVQLRASEGNPAAFAALLGHVREAYADLETARKELGGQRELTLDELVAESVLGAERLPVVAQEAVLRRLAELLGVAVG